MHSDDGHVNPNNAVCSAQQALRGSHATWLGSNAASLDDIPCSQFLARRLSA